ncbi:unnamed protein product, partial [Amoebophrya sp. A25]
MKRWSGLVKQHPLSLMEADASRCLALNVAVLEAVYREAHPRGNAVGSARSLSSSTEDAGAAGAGT